MMYRNLNVRRKDGAKIAIKTLDESYEEGTAGAVSSHICGEG